MASVSDNPFVSDPSRARYLEKRRADLQACQQALATGDFSPIELLAHRMKGNGATFGFPELSRIGGELEAAAQAQDRGRVAASLGELTTTLTNGP